jgi:hypothetical protein
MIPVLRSIAAVVAGYLVFALCAYAFFLLSGQAPHQPASTAIMITGIALGTLFAAAGGYVAAWLAGHHGSRTTKSASNSSSDHGGGPVSNSLAARSASGVSAAPALAGATRSRGSDPGFLF